MDGMCSNLSDSKDEERAATATATITATTVRSLADQSNNSLKEGVVYQGSWGPGN